MVWHTAVKSRILSSPCVNTSFSKMPSSFLAGRGPKFYGARRGTIGCQVPFAESGAVLFSAPLGLSLRKEGRRRPLCKDGPDASSSFSKVRPVVPDGVTRTAGVAVVTDILPSMAEATS